jgi:hypothetical protein
MNEFTKDQLELVVQLIEKELVTHKENNKFSMASLILYKLNDQIKNYCEHHINAEKGLYEICVKCKKKW